MSSERSGRSVIFTCDECGDVGGDTGSFKYVWEDLEIDGWRAFMNDDGDWEHRCPDCVGA